MDFIDLSTHSNVNRHMSSLLMHNLCVVVVFFLSSSSYSSSSSLLIFFFTRWWWLLLLFFFFNMRWLFTLDSCFRVLFPTVVFVTLNTKAFLFDGRTHTLSCHTKCQIISVLLVRSNQYRIVSFVCIAQSTGSHSPYTVTNDNAFCIGVVIISLT